MKVAVAVFPGSNCDHDAYHALKHVIGCDAAFVWHKAADLGGADAVVLPGGFSYGDYLRTGAIARFSPIMTRIVEFAAAGGPVLGICNGFQVLLEAGLLPGGMRRNRGLKFLCEQVHLRVERTDTPFTGLARPGQVLRMPIAHGEGNYYADPAALERLEAEGRIVFRYTAPDGRLDERWNVNGSTAAIAGISNAEGNVVGLMPHPERACEAALGSADGRVVLQSLVEACGAERGGAGARGAARTAPAGSGGAAARGGTVRPGAG
ncbi:MAG: phosphoribosylformylglycinamidine synthase subunit PurQ [Acidobacteria bacterium]|nr:phosphoribosylformylglycinamidine synthase subunit PurQ [Acidobacteriota bacterium]